MRQPASRTSTLNDSAMSRAFDPRHRRCRCSARVRSDATDRRQGPYLAVVWLNLSSILEPETRAYGSDWVLSTFQEVSVNFADEFPYTARWPPLVVVQRVTWVLAEQDVYVLHNELFGSAVVEPVHISNFAQVSEFTTALEKPIPTQLELGAQSVFKFGVWPPP